MNQDGSRSASSSASRTAPFEPSAPGRLDDLGAVEPQQAAPLVGRVLRQHARQRVALQLRDERERDAGVAARRLEQPPAGLELARGLRRLDHRLRDAVLDRAGRVLALELRVDAHRPGREAGQLDERRVPDEVEEARSGRLAPAGHGGQENHGGAVDAGLEPVERAHVLAAEVDVHERREPAVLEELRFERRDSGSARSSSTSRTVSPSPTSSRSPPTSLRSVGGMRTFVTVAPPAQNST